MRHDAPEDSLSKTVARDAFWLHPNLQTTVSTELYLLSELDSKKTDQDEFVSDERTIKCWERKLFPATQKSVFTQWSFNNRCKCKQKYYIHAIRISVGLISVTPYATRELC